MPNFDQTGPNGQGPATGRGQGSCNNQGQNFIGNNFGGGRRGCQGRGGRGRCFQKNAQTLSLDEQEKILEDRLAAMREQKHANS